MSRIELRSVTKKFNSQNVLSSINQVFDEGCIHGVTGRNGSGKTVLFKIICGLTPPSSGEVIIDGKRIGRDIDVPPSIGAILNEPGFIPTLNGFKNLELLARINGKIGKNEIYAVLETVGLETSHRKYLGKYSKGMRQRLGIAQALMEQPRLLVLDEPFSGLDDAGVKHIRDVLMHQRAMGVTILLSSHNTEDIEMLCDHEYYIDAGIMIKKPKSA